MIPPRSQHSILLAGLSKGDKEMYMQDLLIYGKAVVKRTSKKGGIHIPILKYLQTVDNDTN